MYKWILGQRGRCGLSLWQQSGDLEGLPRGAQVFGHNLRAIQNAAGVVSHNEERIYRGNSKKKVLLLPLLPPFVLSFSSAPFPSPPLPPLPLALPSLTWLHWYVFNCQFACSTSEGVTRVHVIQIPLCGLWVALLHNENARVFIGGAVGCCRSLWTETSGGVQREERGEGAGEEDRLWGERERWRREKGGESHLLRLVWIDNCKMCTSKCQLQ